MIRLIVATDIHQGIAKDNQIPWHLKKDLTFFKETTSLAPAGKRNAVIMGRKTHQAMGQKILPNRLNIVLTTQPHYDVPGVVPCASLKEALTYCKNLEMIHHIYIIGGQQVYEEALNTPTLPIDYIYKTILHQDYNCDRFFPTITPMFEEVSRTPTEKEGDILFHMEVWRAYK